MVLVAPMGFRAVFGRSRASAGSGGGEAVGEPSPGQPLDQLGQRRGAGGVQVVAGAGNDSEDLGQGDAIGEVGIHPHRDLDQRVGHQGSPSFEEVVGMVVRVVVVG